MLIMPCRASASRCRVQVTSNVRHPKTSNTNPSNTRASARTHVYAFASKKRCFEETTAQNETAFFSLEAHEFQRRRRALQGLPSSMSASRPNRPTSAEGMRQPVGWSSRRTRQSAPRAPIRDGRMKETQAPGGCPRTLSGRAVAAFKTWLPHLFASHVCLTLR
jgi:hypothetical protein